MHPQIFLSIVTISYNQAPYLRQCVESVIAQKSDDIEYIVVDPGSTDGSREILQSYGDAIDRLILQPDKGPADGLNNGFAEAKGNIGYFVNSDDLIMPDAVATLRRLWGEHSGADVMLGGAWMIDSKNQPLRELRPNRNASLQDFLDHHALTVQQGISFTMALFREIDGFNPANRTCWDFELLCNMLAKEAKVVVVSDRLGAFRLTGNNISSGVGDGSFSRQLNEDMGRIYRELSHNSAPIGALQHTRARAARYYKNPSHLLTYLLDRAVPSRILHRWKADITPKPGR